jgi:hypothetical protein
MNAETYRCDFVTVFIADAANHPSSDLANGVCVWDIPASAYYYNDRSSITVLSVADATLDRNLGDNIVMLTPIGLNSSCSQLNSTNSTLNTSLGVLGSFVSNAQENTTKFNMSFQNHQPIKILSPAQPNQMKLVFIEDDKGAVDLSSLGIGHMTLRFDYYPPSDYVPSPNEFKAAFPSKPTF